MINTKTVATVGPAMASAEMLEKVLGAGVSVLRLNFSHGSLDEHERVLILIRRLAENRHTAVAVMGDLAGPKIRLGEVTADRSVVNTGDELAIQRQPIRGDNRRISTTYPRMIDEVQVGQRVLIDDGNILLKVERKTAEELICRCLHGGVLSDHKGVNLPDTTLSVPALTPKDLTDLAWAIEHQLDFVALSFVRHPDDLRDLKQRLRAAGSDVAVIAKIEKPQAIEHLDAIIDEADGILVARGDLAVEMEYEQVPPLQKDITVRCQRAGKAVIIATQMLQSMVNSPTPTRAEVSDVANAILDSADAVMLSAETAVGRFPAESVAYIQRIARETEAYQARLPRLYEPTVEHHDLPITAALAASARRLAERLNPPLVAVWTQSGSSAKLLSKHRFTQPIIALTENPRTLNKLALYYGVIPIRSTCPKDTGGMLAALDRILLDNRWVTPGDAIIVIAGTSFRHTGGNNALLIHKVGQV